MNTREQLFVAGILEGLSATKAYIRAGYARKGASAGAARLSAKVSVREAIGQGTAKVTESAELTAARVLEEMRRLAFSNVQDLFDAVGNLRPISELTREQAACIAGIEVVMKNATAGDGKVDRVLKVKIWDKPKVMEMLGKHFALLIERIEVNNVSELEQRLHAGRARVAAAKKTKK